MADYQYNLMKNLNRERYQAESIGQISADQSQQSDCLNRKGKNLESDIVEAVSQGEVGLKKPVSSIEVSASSSEKDIVQTKTKVVKTCQTQSGPLTPGIVLNHSLSEKARNFERFVIVCFYFMIFEMT